MIFCLVSDSTGGKVKGLRVHFSPMLCMCSISGSTGGNVIEVYTGSLAGVWLARYVRLRLEIACGVHAAHKDLSRALSFKASSPTDLFQRSSVVYCFPVSLRRYVVDDHGGEDKGVHDESQRMLCSPTALIYPGTTRRRVDAISSSAFRATSATSATLPRQLACPDSSA